MLKLIWTCFVLLAPLAAAAQPAASLTLATGSYTLNLPYLEYGSGTAKKAYGASLVSTNLTSFVVDAASVKATEVLAAAIEPARLEAPGVANAGYRLTLPYLEFSSAGVTRAYTATLSSSDLSTFSVDAGSVREVAVQMATLAPPSAVSLGAVGQQTVGSATFASSSKMLVNWLAPVGWTVDHYEVSATESGMNTRVSASTAATSLTLTGLKAATPYAVVVKACLDGACTRSASAAAASARTSSEHWQLQGSGNSVATLLQPVADGNARLSATRFGPEAGPVANTVQFYYGPKGVTGVAVASSASVSAAVPSSYLSFTSHAASSGVRSPSNASSGIKSIMTGQGVPLSAAMGANVRLFFESNDADGKTRSIR